MADETPNPYHVIEQVHESVDEIIAMLESGNYRLTESRIHSLLSLMRVSQCLNKALVRDMKAKDELIAGLLHLTQK